MRLALPFVACLLTATLAGCTEPLPDVAKPPLDDALATDLGPCLSGTGGPPPPPGEEVLGLQPIDMIFGGSLRHANTRVLLVPPSHGDLGSPANMSRSATSYLEATLEGILSWEPAIAKFVSDYPQFSYLSNVTVQVEVLEQQTPETAGYDIIVGYAETSGPAFRGIAIQGQADTQRPIDEAGLGDLVHYGNRYVLLSLFASAPRSGQDQPDYPETSEVRGVTMHEFAHVWGLGHSRTWTSGCGSDLMNSPYGYVYGDGNPAGDGGERSRPMCINTLALYGLANLYRWLPAGEWQGSEGNVTLPPEIQYKEYCMHEEASARAKQVLAGTRWA